MERNKFKERMKQYKKAREENPGLKYWEWKDIPKYGDGTGNVEKQDNTRVASIEKEQVFIPATGELKRKQELLNKLSRNGQIKSGAIDIVSPEYDLLTGVRAITTLPTKAEKLGRKIFNSNFISDDEITDLINSKRISDLTTFTKKIKNDSDWYVHTDLGKSNSVFAGNGKGAYIQDRHLHPGEALIFDQKPYAWWNRGKRYARLGENEDGYLAIIIKGSNAKDLLQVNKSQNPIGQWNGKSGFVLQSEYVTQQPVNLTPDIEHYIYDGLTKTYGNVKHYKDGGEVQPDTIDPVDMYNRTRYQVNGIPINDKPLDNVLSPWDIPLGTAYKVWPAVNGVLKNYGPTLGAMVVGSTGKTSNKKSSPITTKQIDPTLKEYHEDIVIPLRPQDKYTKQVYLNNPDNFTYNMYADDVLPDNRLADYNPRTGEIRIKESVANSELSPQVQGHESGHRIDQIMPRTDEVKQKIDEALQVGPRPLSKESRLLVEKEGEIDRLGYNLFKYMKDNNLMLIKEPTAKTKAFQEFITNATDELLAQMLGDMTAYTKDYKQRGIDYGLIRWILQNQPMILPGLVIQQDLLTDKTEKQWT